MEKFFRVFSTVAFGVAIIGFIGLGIYQYLQEGNKEAVAAVSDQAADSLPDSPVVVVGDILKEPTTKPQTLDEYAIKEVETELSVETILFYLLGLVVAWYLLKKVIQFWRYLVSHSV